MRSRPQSSRRQADGLHGGTDADGPWGGRTCSGAADGTTVHLTHAGFYDSAAAHRHEEAWNQILAHLDEVLTGTA